MPSLNLVDHSRSDKPPAAKLESASNLILIDNYDSFTWNVYQYLILEGATVTVYRNDKVTLEELIAQKPTQLVISPGPGHPDSDSGVSKHAIKHFAGKIPVFGVCMGQQCMISAFGGKVDVTGEILHGKTSPLRHDGKGVYEGVPQDVQVTRYHSLAGTHPTLPDCLEVSGWISAGPDGGKGIIMGVRHKEYVMEGVQFHPESILTESGRTMLQNFLRMSGGTWKDVQKSKQANGIRNGISDKKANILEKIYARRKELVASQKLVPSQRPQDLQAAYNLGLAPPQISFPDRLRQSAYPVALLAEIKRASPSKGMIQIDACAPAQARKYAQAGASTISVLTEPDWFKGSLEDMRYVRQALESMPNRPAVLRKEFIFDEYQVLEARLAGADTVLLIVKMLDKELLTRLYKYSQSLGMEPLVEVNTAEEMRVAVRLGSKVIGVNNRDLTNFEVDLGTTSRLMDIVPKDTIVCALSGISGPQDVQAYKKEGVKGVLVGEALMRPADTVMFIAQLLGEPKVPRTKVQRQMAVKICGTRSAEAAKTAIESGADFIGVIRVPTRSRFVQDDIVQEIAEVVKNTPKPHRLKAPTVNVGVEDYLDYRARSLERSSHVKLVGVYLNQSLETIVSEVDEFGLDMVQLHGQEPLEWTRSIPVPVIRRFAPGEEGFSARGYQAISLLDAGAGGSGQQLDSNALRQLFEKDSSVKAMLAGGLNASNVEEVLQKLGPFRDNIVAVDTSSGVETEGKQDLKKITAFCRAAKS